MERLDLSSGAMTFKERDDGVIVSARKIEIPRAAPGSVARHEAAHIVASGKIKSATIKPSGDALGTTTPEIMTPVGAAAAAAMGYEGVGYDLSLLGNDVDSAIAAARRELSGKQEEMHEVATLLEMRETIYQSDVEEAKENVRRRQKGIFQVVVEISSLRGKTMSFTMESLNSEVQIKDDVMAPLKAV